MSDFSESTLYCPECGLSYPGSEMFCSVDGSALTSQPPGPVTKRRTGGSGGSRRSSLAGVWAWVIPLVVVVALAALFLPSVMTGQGIVVDVVLEEGFGLSVGDNVYVAGYKAGEVTSMWPEGPGFVARVRIQNDVRDYLWSNCVFYVTPEHILADRRCICVFLPEHEPATAIASGQRIRGIGSLTDVARFVWMRQVPSIAWETAKML